MQFFENAIFALILFIPLFFLVFFYLCYNWSAMHKKKERFIIAAILSFTYGFKILAIGFFILFLVSLILPFLANYIPALRNFFSS
jgi:hypothetical protein